MHAFLFILPALATAMASPSFHCAASAPVIVADVCQGIGSVSELVDLLGNPQTICTCPDGMAPTNAYARSIYIGKVCQSK